MAALARSLIAALEEAKAESRGDYTMFHCTILDVLDLIEADDGIEGEQGLPEALLAARYPEVADIDRVLIQVRRRLALEGASAV